ncbi:hypothetical protein PV08_10178 [Exophiala spinifera]|uniref:Uncharacterized protein n=1 Tax=Exophiala spinifera TaxID=91928 RepID=A0A0D2BHM9_9EURO|nr:uncharacterized protein PV08_10178 [Exophiala spinifera]KIW10879.1 hypothetical protein PV08_10178 [Exophiala spinifera]
MSETNSQVEFLFVESGNPQPSNKSVRSHIIKAANRKKRALSKAGRSVLPTGSRTTLSREATLDESGRPGYGLNYSDCIIYLRRIARQALSLPLVQNPATVLPAQLSPGVLEIMHPIWSDPVMPGTRIKHYRKYDNGHYAEERQLILQNSIPMRIDAFEHLRRNSLMWTRSFGWWIPSLDARRRLYFQACELKAGIMTDIQKELATLKKSRLEIALFTVYKFIPLRANGETFKSMLTHTKGVRAIFFMREDPWLFSDRRISRQLLYREMMQNDACWSLISDPTDYEARVDQFLTQLLKKIQEYAIASGKDKRSFLHPDSFLYRYLARAPSQQTSPSDFFSEDMIHLLVLLLLSIKTSSSDSDVRREYLVFLQSEIHRFNFQTEENHLSLFWILFMCNRPVRHDNQHHDWQAVRFLNILKCCPTEVRQMIRDVLMDFLGGCTIGVASQLNLPELRAQMLEPL